MALIIAALTPFERYAPTSPVNGGRKTPAAPNPPCAKRRSYIGCHESGGIRGVIRRTYEIMRSLKLIRWITPRAVLSALIDRKTLQFWPLLAP
jgi:hypothetical protein